MTLPDYTLRLSKKAKYLQLRFSPHGLEVVVPVKNRLTHEIIQQFIQQKRSWIERNHKIYQVQEEQQTLPTSIHLPAIGKTWNVVYMRTAQKKVTLFTNLSGQITLMGDVSNEKACLKKLQQWFKEIAQYHLAEQLALLSNETKLLFNQVTTRNNITRWGSCSSNGNISLCCKLLFLPLHLMRHVLLHELCHTKAMHHGKTFWRLLERFDENARIHAKQLKIAAKQIPAWVG